MIWNRITVMQLKSGTMIMIENRNIYIREQFKQLRSTMTRTEDAIDIIREQYPYLQFDTIKKIVYTINAPASKKLKVLAGQD
jgi:hypothetical protein